MNYESGQLGHTETLALPGEERPRGRRRAVWIAVAVALALLAAWYAFGRGGGEAGPKGPPIEQAPPVTVIAPGRQTVDRLISANGSLAARREMPVGVVGEGGRVTRVLVEPGQWVGAGQVLATVDRSVQAQTAASLAAQIRVAQADAQLAQNNLDRAKALVANGFVSRADIDSRTAARDAAVARVRVAQAQLAQQRAANGRLDIRAPAAGLVLDRNVEAGQVVGPGSGALFRIAAGGQMELLARMPQDELARIPVGTPAVVTPVGSQQSYQGQVWQVAPVVDPQTRQGEARIAIPYAGEIRPGGFGQAVIEVGTTVAPLLPESAVQSDARGNFVYIIDGNNAVVRRDVRVGEVTDRGVTVVEGLQGDERVVLSAGAFLTPGQRVRPERAQQQPR
jgi:HlyD family secretion protein